MKSLKHIRVLVSVVMLAECVLWVLMGASAPGHTEVARALQLSPLLPHVGLGATLASGLLWLLITFVLGRVYCSSVCPVGTLQDMVIHCTMHRPGGRTRRFSYKKGNNRRFILLGLYVASIVAVIGCVPLLLEPWPAFVNSLSRLTGSGIHASLRALGVGALLGFVCAVVSVALVLLYSLVAGRDFCNEVCPVGTVLRIAGARSLMHIELMPDRCTSCLKCQDVCKASCIDIKTRTIDNARCIRCFNCVAACEDNAIRFTADKGRIVNGLFQRRGQLS